MRVTGLLVAARKALAPAPHAAGTASSATATAPKGNTLLDRVGRVLRIVGLLELAVAMSAFCATLSLVTAQVMARQFGQSLWWAQEWTELFIMYAYFLGISHIYQSRQMIVMDFLTARFARAVQIQLYVGVQILVAIFCGVVAFEALRIAPRELAFPSFIIQVPRFYWTLPLILGSLSMAVTSLYFAFAVPAAARRGAPNATLASLEVRAAFVPVGHTY